MMWPQGMHRARVVAALVDVRAFEGTMAAVEGLRVASGLSWQDFDAAALRLAEAGAIELFEGESRFPVVGARVTYSHATLL
jgi:hypothetical protein